MVSGCARAISSASPLVRATATTGNTADADAYQLARRPRGHLGFGGSVHACLGASIARLSSKIAMEEFHKAMPRYERAETNLSWMPSSTFRSPLRLELTTI